MYEGLIYCSFAFYQSGGENGWLMTQCVRLPHSSALLKASQLQTARCKLSAVTAVLSDFQTSTGKL